MFTACLVLFSLEAIYDFAYNREGAFATSNCRANIGEHGRDVAWPPDDTGDLLIRIEQVRARTRHMVQPTELAPFVRSAPSPTRSEES